MIRSIARGISLALLGALSFAASVQAKVKPGEVQPDSIDVDAFDFSDLPAPRGLEISIPVLISLTTLRRRTQEMLLTVEPSGR